MGKLDPKHEGKVKTLVFLSPLEYEKLTDILFSLEKDQKDKLMEAYSLVDKDKLAKDDGEVEDEEGKDEEKKKKGDKKITVKKYGEVISKIFKTPIKKVFKIDKEKEVPLVKDAADIALFGRMVASDNSLNVEGAAMFSHVLSTHKVDNEIDFFTAVDDIPTGDDAGAGMTGTLEFNSATYYRFAALNLDMLADESHLASMSKEERQQVVRTFVEATIKAVPTARKNSMNGNTLPVYVLGIVREKGHPVQLINAFEKPIKTNQGYAEESVSLLKGEYEKLKTTWGLDAAFEKAIPDVGIKEFLDGVVSHVI